MVAKGESSWLKRSGLEAVPVSFVENSRHVNAWVWACCHILHGIRRVLPSLLLTVIMAICSL